MSERGEGTRSKIKEAAHRLFSEKGFKSVTMKDICEATGLSRGGLYRHFSSTEEILLSILGTKDNVDENIQRGESATEILEGYLKTYKEEMIDSEKSLSLAIYEYANLGNGHIFAEGTEVARRRWSKLVEYGIRTGEFNEVNPEQIADVMLFAYQGVRMWSRVIPMGETTAEHVVNTIRQLLVKQ
jgi:AcrR family transcriptional regulator